MSKDLYVPSVADAPRESSMAVEASRYVAPPGWVLVPETPTEEMQNAARDWSYRKYGKPIGGEASFECYRAMIAAAPHSGGPQT